MKLCSRFLQNEPEKTRAMSRSVSLLGETLHTCVNRLLGNKERKSVFLCFKNRSKKIMTHDIIFIRLRVSISYCGKRQTVYRDVTRNALSDFFKFFFESRVNASHSDFGTDWAKNPDKESEQLNKVSRRFLYI